MGLHRQLSFPINDFSVVYSISIDSNIAISGILHVFSKWVSSLSAKAAEEIADAEGAPTEVALLQPVFSQT